MLARPARALAMAAILLAPVYAQPPEAPKYLLPPDTIVKAFDAEPIPSAILSASRTIVALPVRRPNPTIAELARPMLRLAGARVDPKYNGPHLDRGGRIYEITLKKVADFSGVKVAVPPQPNISNLRFSPNGARLAFTNTKDAAIELWVADTATGHARLVSGVDRLNAAAVDAAQPEPCDWLEDSVTLVCTIVPPGRGPAPVVPAVPSGPNVQDNDGKAAQAATYEDLLQTAFDDTLFEYYFTSQIAAFDTTTGRRTLIGRPSIIDSVAPSPNGEYLLVTRVKRPFSHLIPRNGFPNDVEVWTRRGDLVKTIADVPSREGTPPGGVTTAPRNIRWRPDQPATLVWAEALDGGNPKTNAPVRDKVMTLAAPFTVPPSELAKTEYRFANVAFTDRGIGLLTETDRPTRTTRTWILEPGAQPRKLWDRKQEARYTDPGTPVARRDITTPPPGGGGRGTTGRILQNGDWIYLTGAGSSPQGDRPFIDRLNLRTLQTERLYRAAEKAYETVAAPLSDDARTILTRYETPSDPPNYLVRDLAAKSTHALTAFTDPQPLLRGVTHELITYQRKDGVKLSGTLYLPPGYKTGERLPLIMWAYPREFSDPDAAGEVAGSPYRFTIVNGASHLFLLLDGYAVLDDPAMPIVGAGETANDTYVEQLVASAEAAIDKVVDMGVADRNRIGVGGHSYGAFMTANLLAHSRLFKAGFAESGAYNRTLTPFGFQNERRTFWEVPDLYGRMSPFFYADKVKDPILLMHGEADDNSGTFPIQSERFYMALKGFGATVRYITLPYEAHGYAARETLLDVIAEKVSWFGKYVKNASARTTTAQRR